MAAARRDDARIRQFFAAYTKPEKVGWWWGGRGGRCVPVHPPSACSGMQCRQCSRGAADSSRAGLTIGSLRPPCPPSCHLQVARECQALTDACEFLVADRWGRGVAGRAGCNSVLGAEQ